MKLNFSLRLRVFNLNCWDIPYLSKHRADRMKRLGDFLNLENFDLALLEEVWSEQDFQYLRQRLSLTYPDAHYFRSGMIGSGLCVFSKHPIQEIFQHVYSLNGYPYMVRISSLSLLTQTGRSLPGALAGGCQYPEFLSSLACSSIMETGSVGSLWGCWCSV